MNKRDTVIVFLTSAIVGALLALAYFFFWGGKDKGIDIVKPVGIVKKEGDDTVDKDKSRPRPTPITVDEDASQRNARYDMARTRDNPEAIAKAMANLARTADMGMLDAMLEHNLIPRDVAGALRSALEKGGYKLNEQNPISEVGEIQRSTKVRWALNLEDGRRILVDMEKDEKGKWSVTKISLPSTSEGGEPDVFLPETNDALGIIDAFMRATIAQRFDVAKRFVDGEKVADATIAGICILFEEGHYRLRKSLPLRNMFLSKNDEGDPVKAGFLAYVQSSENKEAGNIGLTLEREDNESWKIYDLALDSLLQDYASRFGEGDELYLPLVKNPKGGDSLVLYFGFDEAILTPRSLRQLEIVSQILKLDPSKKIEITGHTDDLGSDRYNQVLSEARANAVREALINSGLGADQVVTKGFGKLRQRRTVQDPNAAEVENIRRANRRAEIYLDF